MTIVPRSACILSETSRSENSTGDMRYFQANIDRPSPVCKTADRDVIDAGGCNTVHILEGNTATCLEFDIVFSQRNSFANLSRRHIVDQDHVYSRNFNEGTNLFQVTRLHFDSDIWSSLSKLLDPVCKTREPFKSSQMVIFHEYHVV